MRKTIIVASTAFLCAGAACAGEMSVGKMQASYDNPAMRWSGPYTGAAAGFSWGKVRDHDLDAPREVLLDYLDAPVTMSKTINGASYGGYVGHNWVAGQIVYGVEANFSGSTMNADLLHADQVVLGTRNDYVYQTEHEVTWYGTAVGRLGVAQGPLLFYVNGGVVLGNDKTSFSASYGDTIYYTNQANTTHWGWTAGAGAEYAINDVLSARVEYDHIDYADKTIMDGTDKVSVRFETVKFGVTVKMQ